MNVSSFEEDHSFSCPYCQSFISIRVDVTGGRTQVFVVDCEVCCRPIDIKLEEEDGQILNFDAESEAKI